MLTEHELDAHWRQITRVSVGAAVLGLFVFLGLRDVANAQRDVADAHRRQAAAQCIEHWQSWVRGTWSPPTPADAEFCGALAGVEFDRELGYKLMDAMQSTARDWTNMIKLEQAARDNEVRTMCEASCELEASEAEMNEWGKGP